MGSCRVIKIFRIASFALHVFCLFSLNSLFGTELFPLLLMVFLLFLGLPSLLLTLALIHANKSGFFHAGIKPSKEVSRILLVWVFSHLYEDASLERALSFLLIHACVYPSSVSWAFSQSSSSCLVTCTSWCLILFLLGNKSYLILYFPCSFTVPNCLPFYGIQIYLAARLLQAHEWVSLLNCMIQNYFISTCPLQYSVVANKFLLQQWGS